MGTAMTGTHPSSNAAGSRVDPPAWTRHLVAVLVSVFVAVLWLALDAVVGTGFKFLIACPALALVAWFGGAGPGMVATGLMALVGVQLREDPGSPVAAGELARLGVFVASGVIISGLAESLHRARRSVVAAAVERGRVQGMLAASQHLAHVGSWELDLDDVEHLDRNRLRWSDECFRIFGREPGTVQVTNALFFEAVHPDDREAISTTVSRAVAERRPYELEHRIRRPDGSERWVHEWATVVTDERGRPLRMLGTCQDVTERRRAEVALREREDQLRLIMDAAPVLISYVDATYRYRMVNRAYERWFQRSPADIQGCPVRELIGETAWSATRPYMDRALAGEVVTYERELPYPTGPRWVHVSYVPDRAEDAGVRGFVVVAVDIAERKRAEATLRRAAEQTERLRLLAAGLSEALTNAQVGRVIVERAAPILDAAAGCVGLLEEGVVQLLDHAGLDPVTLEPWCRFSVDAAAPMAEAVRTRRPVLVRTPEERARRWPDLPQFLAPRTVGASASVPMIIRERVVGVLAFAWDAPREFSDEDEHVLLVVGEQCAQALDRARLHAAEQEARARAEGASRAKDEFLAMLGHELRNPLAPIMTAVQLMKLRGDRTSAKERSVIERQTTHLVQLVDDLLDVSRIAGGKLQLKRAPVELGAVLAKAVETASPLFEQKRHRLTVDAPHGLRLEGDETRLAQVFANLLTNAAKYTPPGGAVDVHAWRERGELVVAVKDDGVGIEPDLLPRVFDLFVQGPRGVDRGQGGLGLGLALVRNLVVLHGGSVHALSDGPGHGSEFRVRLPALPVEESPAATSQSPPAREAAANHPSLQVLVVDDNRDAAETLAELLSSAGHRLAVAHDGPQALRALETFKADVAILDIGLPVMDGYELAQRVRSTRGAAAPVLIALTGYGQADDRARSSAAGFAAHLVKPVDGEHLLSTLESATAPG